MTRSVWVTGRLTAMLGFTLAALCLLPSLAAADGIAVISHVDIAPYRAAIDGFRQQVALPISRYLLNNDNPETVRDAITAQRPELIFVLGKPALRFARTLQQHPPIVLALVLHPEPLDANESGVAMTVTPALQLQTLLAITPNIHTIGAIYNPEKSAALIAQIKHEAAAYNIHILSAPIRTHAAAAQSAKRISPQVDAIWMMPDTTALTTTLFQQMVRLSRKHSFPLIGLAPKYVRAGCLFALSFDNRAVGEQAGRLARHVLQTGTPIHPQLEPLETNKLSINTQTADLLGITIPANIMQQANLIYPIRRGGSNR